MKRGVSSAVHTIHIGASPDTVPKKKKKKGQLNRKTTQQTNPAQPSVKSVGGADCVLIPISVQQPSPTCTQVGVCSHAGSLHRNEAAAASGQNRKKCKKIRKEKTQHQH